MTNRNNDRMVAPLPPQQNTQPQPQNSLLNFVAPTEFVKLPSKGNYYPDGHPLKGKDSLEIKFMTAKDEDILSSPSLLKEGVALDRLLKNIVIDKTINTDSLLIGDKNAILISARISGYGNIYETEVTCPSCGKKSEFEFDLFSAQKVVHGSLPENVQVNEKGNFVFKLPSSKVDLEVKLLTGLEEKRILKILTSDKENSSMIEQYRMMIVSANTVTDKKMLSQFIDVMPISDSVYLKNIYKEISPNVDLKEKFQCYSCGHEQELEVPLGADFFWPNR